jgi:hypothetical protein
LKEKNFKFRASFGKLVESMTDKQAGEFIKVVSGYAFCGKPMETKDEYLKGVFIYVKNVLDTEMISRQNGKKGADVLAEKRHKGKALDILLSSVVLTAEKLGKDNKKSE